MTGSEITQLLERYLDETISEEDFKKLFEALADKTHQQNLDILMEELLENQALRNLSDPQGQKSALMRIYALSSATGTIEPSTTNPAPIKSMFTSKIKRWIAAASVVIIAGIAVFTFNQNKKENIVNLTPPAETTNDILPGSRKALLTLSNGNTISLDDASNGIVGREGSSEIIKSSEGEVVYQSKGQSNEVVLFNTLATPRGGQFEVVLPDGTKVWLNAASSITYPVAFNGKERNVRITGEAYFEVAPNKTKPFIVAINESVSVRVLGTHFNVNSYVDQGSIQTTLLEGKIELAVQHDQEVANKKEVVLKPGEQAQVTANDSEVQIHVLRDVDLEEVMAWKNGYFHFSNTSLQSMMRQVERWYDVEVIYAHPAPQLRFGGEIKRDLTLSQLLEGLSEMGVKIERKERKLYIQQ